MVPNICGGIGREEYRIEREIPRVVSEGIEGIRRYIIDAHENVNRAVNSFVGLTVQDFFMRKTKIAVLTSLVYASLC